MCNERGTVIDDLYAYRPVSYTHLRQANDFDPQIVPYAKSALNGGGKHLRPTLVALAGGSIGKVGDAHITAAVIIEMVHLATLVHDDVMDEAEIRRGQLTVAANLSLIHI